MLDAVDRLPETRHQRQCQKAMGDRLAARHLTRGALDIDMDPLMVAGRIGEFVDDRLIDGEPVADADLLADIMSEIRRPFEFDHPFLLMVLMPIVYAIYSPIGKAGCVIQKWP